MWAADLSARAWREPPANPHQQVAFGVAAAAITFYAGRLFDAAVGG